MKPCVTYVRDGQDYKNDMGDIIKAEDLTMAMRWNKSLKACPTNYYRKSNYVYDWDYC